VKRPLPTPRGRPLARAPRNHVVAKRGATPYPIPSVNCFKLNLTFALTTKRMIKAIHKNTIRNIISEYRPGVSSMITNHPHILFQMEPTEVNSYDDNFFER
jgi:hypothetical protein